MQLMDSNFANNVTSFPFSITDEKVFFRLKVRYHDVNFSWESSGKRNRCFGYPGVYFR